MKVAMMKYPNGDFAQLFWPDDVPTHEISETDLRYLLRWQAVLGPDDLARGRTTALFKWDDVAPLLTEIRKFDG